MVGSTMAFPGMASDCLNSNSHAALANKKLREKSPPTEAALLNSVPQELTCRIVNEVQLGAGRATHG